jgi:hypothetical protein
MLLTTTANTVSRNVAPSPVQIDRVRRHLAGKPPAANIYFDFGIGFRNLDTERECRTLQLNLNR